MIRNLLLLGAIIMLWGCGGEDSPPPDFDSQLAADLQDIDHYLDQNSLNVDIDPSGLRYLIHEQGTGATAHPDTSDITVNYEGRLMVDNSIFDQGDTITFPLRNLILGWRIGVPLIQEGGSITLYIPSGYGYGTQGAGAIPPNANLIFDLDLVEVD